LIFFETNDLLKVGFCLKTKNIPMFRNGSW